MEDIGTPGARWAALREAGCLTQLVNCSTVLIRITAWSQTDMCVIPE